MKYHFLTDATVLKPCVPPKLLDAEKKNLLLKEKGSYIWPTTALGRQSCVGTRTRIQNLLINDSCLDPGRNQIKKAVDLLQREVKMFFGTTDKV